MKSGKSLAIPRVLYYNRGNGNLKKLDYIEHAVDCNNSDFDLCCFAGKPHIVYSWGNQYGKEFLALAEYDGTMEEFLQSFFE